MLRIGVLGAGHLGKIHIRCAKEIPDLKMVGFFDPDIENAKLVEQELGVKRFDTVEELTDEVDIIDIVTPTVSHFDCASQAIRKSRHIFIEKPLTNTIAEAQELIKLSEEANVKVQVGHVERFNPAFLAAQPYCNNPLFIEAHRLSQFNPRGTDVPVVLDLMIHDIDIILSVVKSGIRKISASGVAVVSEMPDIANARIEFDNGCVANLTASRISVKNMRKARFFQRDAYIAVDFLNKDTKVFRLNVVEGEPDPMAMIIDFGNNKPKKQIHYESPEIKPVNAIKTELEAFTQSIINNTLPPVSIHDGFNALEIAYRIMEKIDSATVQM
ncbi:MAG: Gfo/Idh/MocA family oxidoreductase [Bacteroidota bacterium]